MCGRKDLGIITEATLKLLPSKRPRPSARVSHDGSGCNVWRNTPARLAADGDGSVDRNCSARLSRISRSVYRFGGRDFDCCRWGFREQRTKRGWWTQLSETGGLTFCARNEEEEDKLWDVRRAISPSLMKYGSLKINEDVVVPRSRVPELISKVEEIGRKHDTFVANFGHAGDGNIHVNFLCNRDDADSIARARECVKETFALSVELGGSISGEHGIGYVKAAYLDMRLTRRRWNYWKESKSFRPERHFNRVDFVYWNNWNIVTKILTRGGSY